MLFNSYPFLLLYLPIVLTGFFSLTHFKKNEAARGWLLLSSLWFYGYWDVRFLPLLIGSILFNYVCGSQILQNSSHPATKKWLILIGIIGDLSLLFYFKYCNFFLSVFNSASFSLAEVILPLGISFFTFTQIAYLVDAYQGKAEPCDMISYGLFVTIFPHLIAGPILHHKEMIKQFHSEKLYALSWSNIAQGTFLFVLGMSKKVLIADYLAEFVKPVFAGDMISIPFIHAWFGALSYTLQLYFDFSGYSDMAVGLGLMFNLHLPINFNSPYQASSIIDFWRRWHITLSSFLRDYLYIPLGGNRYGEISKLRNLLITMILGGLWHGAGWTFVLWGACHGCFLIVNHLWRNFGFSMPNWLARLFTLLAVIVSWVIFRSPTISTALNILGGMIGMHGLVLPPKYEASLGFLKSYGVAFFKLKETNFGVIDLIITGIICIAVLILPNSHTWTDRFKQRPVAWALPCAVLFLLSFIHIDDLTEFLYYQF